MGCHLPDFVRTRFTEIMDLYVPWSKHRIWVMVIHAILGILMRVDDHVLLWENKPCFGRGTYVFIHVTVPEQVINLSISAPVQEGVLTEHTCNKLCQHRRTSQHEPQRNFTPKTCDMKRDELWYNILTWQWQYVYTMCIY